MNPSIKAQLFGTLRLESADVDVDPELLEVTEDDLEETPEGESSVAEAIGDVELDSEVDEIEDQGDDLEDAAEGLDDLDVAVESYRKTGGKLTPIESAALKLAVNQCTARFVRDTGNLVPAIEDFKNDAEHNTRLAHENIKETAKTFKDGIVKAAKAAYERLKEIIKNFINRFRGVIGRADKIIVAAKAIKEQISGDVELNKDNYSVGGEFTFEVVKDGLERLNHSISKMKDLERSQHAIDGITNLAAKEGKVNAHEIFAEQNSFMDKSFREVFGEVTEEEGKIVSKPFPGEYRAALIKGKEKSDLHYEEFDRRKNEDKDTKGMKGNLPALQANEILNIAASIKATQGLLKAFDGFIKRFGETMVRLNSVHAGSVEKVQDAKEFQKEHGKEEAKLVSKAVWRAMTRQMTFYSKLISGTNNISHDMLTWCEKSIQKAGKKDEGAENKAPESEPEKKEEAKAE